MVGRKMHGIEDSALALHEHVAQDESRLTRIESKIDKLTDIMVSLARAEEKLIGLEADQTIITERLNTHSNRLDEVEDKTESSRITINIITNIFWICLTAIAGAAAAQYFIF
jgi:predicted  nucleic acid-binding Zn-ribbon protein